MTYDGSHNYYYDAENRLVQIDGTAGYCSSGSGTAASACYVYDALSRRVHKSGAGVSVPIDYVYDLRGNVMSEFSPSCSGSECLTVGYVNLNGALVAEYKNATTYFVHHDHLGSARLLTGVGSDLVSNPGFESGLTGWSASNTTVITDSTRAHSGSNYAQLSAPANGSATVLGQNLAVQPGDQINFGGWAYLESGGGSAVGWLLQAENSSQTGIAWIGAGPMPATSSGWTFQSGTYTVPSGVAYVELYAQIWQATAASVLRADDGFLYNNRTSLQIAQNLDYLPFGELNSSDSGISTHKFTGDEHDSETNLEHTWFRQNSSSLGRWMTPDPAGLAAVNPSNPQSWNRYAYVINRPLNSIDRTGLHPVLYAPECGTALDMSPQCSGGGPGSLTGGTGLGAVFGNDIFDAISGVAGTYLYMNMYGNMSFGFSDQLWSETLNYIDAANVVTQRWGTDPVPTTGYNVLIQNLGVDTVTSGFIPDLLLAAAQGSSAAGSPPTPPATISAAWEFYHLEMQGSPSTDAPLAFQLMLAAYPDVNQYYNDVGQWTAVYSPYIVPVLVNYPGLLPK